jgi:uncharacterized membrane protein
MNEDIKYKVPESAVHALNILMGIGLVLIIYDYSRDFLFASNFYPTDLSKTNFEIFMSRWLTYFGAPILMLVAGIHTAFKRLLGWKSKDLALYLVQRGVFLIFVEIVIVSFGFNFGFGYPIYFMMLGVLGLSYFVLAGLVFLPFKASLMFGVAIILGHDMLPVFGSEAALNDQALLVLLHGSGAVKIFGHTAFLIYSLIPWLGVVALGYGLGDLYKLDPEKRKKALMIIGVVLFGGFVIFRLLNGYGNPENWWQHSKPLFTFLSFINVNKFPASVQYLLLTLGPIFMFLSWVEARGKTIFDRFSVFGKTPLFFYICGLYLIHIFAVLVGGLQGYQTLDFIAPAWNFPNDFGLGSFETSLAAIVLFAALYPLCRLVDSLLGESDLSKTELKPQFSIEGMKSYLRNF